MRRPIPRNLTSDKGSISAALTVPEEIPIVSFALHLHLFIIYHSHRVPENVQS